ncbi:MAG: ABC transporter permease [Candidatus Cloacimonadales bacterium]|nr:ABC transporter permease [Candidatus Cloacimonadales bacterium]
MRTILILMRKEFKQIFRNKAMLPILFVMPIIQLLILSNAADFEIKHVYVGWEDFDHSPASQKLFTKFAGNPYFIMVSSSENMNANDEAIRTRKIDLVIAIPADFERNLQNGRETEIQLRINAIDGSAAGLIMSYVSQVISDYEMRDFLKLNREINFYESRYLYNLGLKYKNYMVPGILVILVTIIGMILNALNIAREKEIGTIEQINVTPIKKQQFIAGKLLPMLILGIAEFTIGLLIALLVFKVPFFGSFLTLYAFLIVYLVVMLAMGLYISTQVNTQQQAMFLAFFVIMIFIFLSGMFSAVENMPVWGQYISKFIPISYFMRDVRTIMLKGATFRNLINDFLILVAFAIVSLGGAILSYRKKSG